MDRGIFLINNDNKLIEMQSSPYESELALQSLIANFPRLLASCAAEQEDAQWLLISREVSVPDNENTSARWSLDHLLLDSDGVPVLVEVKRSTDTRIRREIVGQMLDYAANAVVHWPIEHIQTSYKSECDRVGIDPQDNLLMFLDGRMDEESFWTKVKTNIQAGRIRMLFVADKIPDNLKRIIEFMNTQMDPAEVLGVEVRQFTDGNFKTIAPLVVGRTAVAESRKQPLSRLISQARESLIETTNAFDELAAGQYLTAGSARDYRQAKIQGFPASLHYEFLHRNSGGVTLEFHIESEKYQPVSSTLKSIANSLKSSQNWDIEFDPKWSKGKGRLRVSQEENAPLVAAQTMLRFIELTKEEIRSAIDRCM